ncbi:MAG: RNA methyltransferase [Candidatus Izimaplasma sp.]|nr:RNA methyltransferase [Candidatus Izimaplasma bacterium]
MDITSVNNSLIKQTVKLHQKKYRDAYGKFIIEGYHLYEEASEFNIIENIFTTDKAIEGENVYYVSERILAKLSTTKSPQKVLCVCRKVNKNIISNRVLILDNIQDPGNLGTLLRSALAFEFNTIILDNTVDLYNSKVIRSTQGAIFHLNIITMKTTDFIDKYSKYFVYGTSFNGVSLAEVKSTQNIAIILGNEGQGISQEILNKTYKNISIKTSTVDSLNVGVAGSIIMHHINNI